MKVIETTPPHDVMLAVMDRWADFARPGDPTLQELAAHRDETFMQEVWGLGLTDCASDWRTKAVRSGWRLLAGNRFGHASAAVVGKAEPRKMTALARGEEIAGLIRAAKRLRELVASKNSQAEYTERVLKIPGLLVEAFWLRSHDGAHDFVIVYRAKFCGGKLPLMKQLTAREFGEIIEDLAKKRLAVLNKAQAAAMKAANGKAHSIDAAVPAIPAQGNGRKKQPAHA